MHEDLAHELAGKIQRLRATGNHPEAMASCIVANFPNLPPSGIKYSLNFSSFQKDGRFAVQVK